jgi:two-component system response regulator CpxR
MSQILIIDDDTELCDLLVKYLSAEGFNISCSHNGKDGIRVALSQDFKAIILDVMLPNINGFEVLKKIREKSQVPVLMLTARGDDIDRIVGLEIGADDYLSKPCNPRELVARLRSIIRRSERVEPAEKIYTLDDLIIDSNKRNVTVDGQVLELTNAEYNIIQLLSSSPGQAFSKEELTEHSLNRKYTAFDRSIDVHISNLRHKLGENKNGEPRIKTVRGFGYLYDA